MLCSLKKMKALLYACLAGAPLLSAQISLPTAFIHVGQDPSKYINTQEPKEEKPLKKELSFQPPRADILSKIDRVLEMATTARFKTFELFVPHVIQTYEPGISELQTIADDYGFFSDHPIVATASTNPLDLSLTCKAIKDLYKNGNLELVPFASAEIFSKIMAYRLLEEGQLFNMPAVVNGEIVALRYRVDKRFNLWLGIPAYGLIPTQKGAPAILLFRGTDLGVPKLDAVASLLSDLDPRGPGFTLFERSRPELHAWLQKANDLGHTAVVMGHSLGGALAIYAYVYEYELVAKQGSIVFNPPGVKEFVINQYNDLPPAWQNGLTVYVTEGDVVSKTGKLLGQVYQLSTGLSYSPLYAHTLLISGQKQFDKALVDVDKENSSGR